MGVHGDRLTPKRMVLHDRDSKAVISSADGKLVYADLNTFKPIQDLVPPLSLRRSAKRRSRTSAPRPRWRSWATSAASWR